MRALHRPVKPQDRARCHDPDEMSPPQKKSGEILRYSSLPFFYSATMLLLILLLLILLLLCCVFGGGG